MTPRRRLVSAFLLVHSLSVVIGALPPATQWVDDSAFAPLRRAAGMYLKITGLDQRWAMFANPPRYDQYLRLRYYVRSSNGRVRTVTELVRPAHRESGVRMLVSFRDSYVDKALDIAVSDFYRRRSPDLIRPDTRPDELPDDLAPIARYFARRYGMTLAGGGSIGRVEVWVGTVPNPAPGEEARPDLTERLTLLEDYYQGPVEDVLRGAAVPPYHAIEREAGIEWILEYYEET